MSENKEIIKEEVKVETAPATEEEVLGCGTYKFRNPVLIDGELKTEIEYDLEELDGNDVVQAVKTLAENGIMVTFAETDQNYHAAIFAIAAGIDFMDVKRFKFKDFTKVCNIVRNFFLED